MTTTNNQSASHGKTFDPIAIIGMRGRFPGADDLDQFWQNLAEGVESIARLSPEEMRAAGVPDHLSRMPGYVNASPILEDIDEFDAEFFGYSARDASLTDPQQRIFIETAWEALEDAGYDPSRYPGAIGVFGGCELSSYLYQLYKNIDSLGYLDGMQLMITNEKDYLCTQVSYRLNLRGPSITVQTACSTSLVAISLACESLQNGECDMALAGGVTVRVPQRGGYFYTAGSILSPDGHCRPFDSNAQGTIVGSGVGLVVLKRLDQAIADHDNIRAVILGTGVNNDGNDKVGYTAPSFRGQAAAIRAAQAKANVPVESIGYIEAHGTGTILGDPIELAALTEVFNSQTDKRGFCGIGSVKSNVGHLSCAAGAVGLMKAVLAMEQGAIPPTVHYQSPNPAIDFAASPFYVTTSLHPWKRQRTPRRAGVSSFGVGGTNAHIVLEEAPEQPEPTNRRSHQLLTLSARSETALDTQTSRLATYLEKHPELDLADVAFTQHLGRQQFHHRRIVVCDSDDRDSVISSLKTPEQLATATATESHSVVFMFPGQGSQYPGMAATLYKQEPVVKAAIDYCAKRLNPYLDVDLRKLLFPGKRRQKTASETLQDTRYAQPAIFTIEYALAELWKSWGIQPAAMIGHSVGEYVAATLSGVLALDDALNIIARRGELISNLPKGSMLAVMAAKETVERFVGDEISLAAVNAPGLAVLSGPDAAIDRVEVALNQESVAARRLHTSHAFHSAMMDPILGEFEDLVASVSLSEPNIPFVTTLTGEWADGPVTKPQYWSAQLRSTVRFADALHALTTADSPIKQNAILLEVGPGRTLVTFANQTINGSNPGNPAAPMCLASLPGPNDSQSDTEMMLTSLGRLWANGIEVDWEGFHQSEQRSRVSLPTYPFERRSYWIGKLERELAEEVLEARDVSDWFYQPSWQAQSLDPAKSNLKGQRILILDEQNGLGTAIVDHLRTTGGQPITVRSGKKFKQISAEEYIINPTKADDYLQLANQVCEDENRLAGVIDCWSAGPPGNTDLDEAAVITLLGPMRLVHALSNQSTVRPLPMLIVARGTSQVFEEDMVDPARALGIGPAKVLPQEHPGIRIAHVDIDDDSSVADALLAELAANATEPTVALREGQRYIETFEPVTIASSDQPPDLPENPVVMITGGVGHMGLYLAEALFDSLNASLILVGRTALPEPELWAELSENQTLDATMRSILKRLARMRNERDDVVVLAADMNDQDQVLTAVDEAISRFGRIDLVIHGAARVDAGAFGSAAETGPQIVEAQFSPKIRGLIHLIDAFQNREPAKWVLHSSISSVLGGLGLAAYAASNAVLDAVALSNGGNWLSIGWDAWDNAAEAHSAGMPVAIQPPEGQEAFLRILGSPDGSRLVVAVNDLDTRLQDWIRHDKAESSTKSIVERHPRPNLTTALVEPRTETEAQLAEIWGDQLGVTPVGIHDGFFDLGGHSLLAVQVASQIRDQFQIEMPVLKLFQAPTIAELAVLVDQALASGTTTSNGASAPPIATSLPDVPAINGDSPGNSAKASYREFYDDVTRRLERSGVGEASFFLNYGYISQGNGDEARFDVPDGTFNPSSVRLAFELIGDTELAGKQVLDVGCGRGGTVVLMADVFQARATGVDLSPEAVAFCRRTHQSENTRFEVGDAENLSFEDGTFNIVTNIESSHTYPNLRAFYAEVKRVLESGGKFLYTDLLPIERWAEVQVLLGSLGLNIVSNRDITPNVLASCDAVAATRAKAFDENSALIDNFLAVPGSMVYEQMNSGAWEYRILRAIKK